MKLLWFDYNHERNCFKVSSQMHQQASQRWYEDKEELEEKKENLKKVRERERDDDVVETSVELMTEDQTETKRWKTMKTMTNYSKKRTKH